MIQDPGSGYGYEAGILFEKSLTVNVTVTVPNGRPWIEICRSDKDKNHQLRSEPHLRMRGTWLDLSVTEICQLTGLQTTQRRQYCPWKKGTQSSCFHGWKSTWAKRKLCMQSPSGLVLDASTLISNSRRLFSARQRHLCLTTELKRNGTPMEQSSLGIYKILFTTFSNLKRVDFFIFGTLPQESQISIKKSISSESRSWLSTPQVLTPNLVQTISCREPRRI